MIELAIEALNQLRSEAASYPIGIQIWMKLMAVSFLVSILFVYSKVGARWILCAFVVNILGLIAGKMLLPEFSRAEIGTHLHIMFWPVMLWMIWKPSSRPSLSFSGAGIYGSSYIVWLVWATTIMSVSLILDFGFLLKLLFS